MLDDESMASGLQLCSVGGNTILPSRQCLEGRGVCLPINCFNLLILGLATQTPTCLPGNEPPCSTINTSVHCSPHTCQKSFIPGCKTTDRLMSQFITLIFLKRLQFLSASCQNVHYASFFFFSFFSAFFCNSLHTLWLITGLSV